MAKMLLGLLFSTAALALSNSGGLGVRFENTNEETALLTLADATYRGFYNSTSDVYIFKNIRFAAPPLGALRWAKPAPPPKVAEIQDGKIGQSCVQSSATPRIASKITTGEDCLFLDLTVPSKAIKSPSNSSLPVVVHVYGGAYVVGSKESRGSAETFIRASKGNLIWVTGNYRLGAYGFLTGTTVEKEGVANAGLWDQRAVFEWVQQNIALVGGDKKSVTAMGISAGAGSILHHLLFGGGKMDPLFVRAIIQSPGYSNFQDRAGQLERNYKRFEDFAGCKGKGLACMRALSEEDLKSASYKANSGQRQGTFAFGPAPDGTLILRTPALELEAGRYWKGLDSIISSHVANEGGMFTDSSVTDDDKFSAMLLNSYGNRTELAKARAEALRLFPPLSSPDSPYKTQKERMSQYVSENSFTCHNRLVAEAYPGKVYSVQYAVPPATHGSDQMGTFLSTLNPQYANLSQPELEAKTGFQSYLISFALTGNPNTKRNPATTIDWPLTTGVDAITLSKVLNVNSLTGQSGFNLIDDPLQVKERCAYWTNLQKTVETLLG